ncbi:MAG: hypothetical protein NC828_05800, partial [Candidatus Omnitrophica bacterium]|nr:hypothetical protein [Candidatus Omnitrophota bacterium]
MITEIQRKITKIFYGPLNFRKLFFLIAILLILFPIYSYAQIRDEWIMAKGYFCTLYIKPDVNIDVLNRKIDTYRVDFGLSEKPSRLIQGVRDEVLYKFDLIFLKVQEVLDMRPP